MSQSTLLDQNPLPGVDDVANQKAATGIRYKFLITDFDILRQWTIEDDGVVEPNPTDDILTCTSLGRSTDYTTSSDVCCHADRVLGDMQDFHILRHGDAAADAVGALLSRAFTGPTFYWQPLSFGWRPSFLFGMSVYEPLESQGPRRTPVACVPINDEGSYWMHRTLLEPPRDIFTKRSIRGKFSYWLDRLPKTEAFDRFVLCAMLAIAQHLIWPKYGTTDPIEVRMIVPRAEDKDYIHVYKSDIPMDFLRLLDEAKGIRTLKQIPWPRVVSRKIPYKPYHTMHRRLEAEVLPAGDPLLVQKDPEPEKKRKRSPKTSEATEKDVPKTTEDIHNGSDTECFSCSEDEQPAKSRKRVKIRHNTGANKRFRTSPGISVTLPQAQVPSSESEKPAKSRKRAHAQDDTGANKRIRTSPGISVNIPQAQIPCFEDEKPAKSRKRPQTQHNTGAKKRIRISSGISVNIPQAQIPYSEDEQPRKLRKRAKTQRDTDANKRIRKPPGISVILPQAQKRNKAQPDAKTTPSATEDEGQSSDSGHRPARRRSPRLIEKQARRNQGVL